jgi:hypothetical protein
MATDKPTDKPTDNDTATATVATATDPVVELYNHWQALTTDDPAVVQERIIRSIITANTPHDLLNAGAATPASQVYDVPLRITGIRASESDFADGVDWFLHVDATIIANGDQITVSCGARDVCIKLVKADMEGWFPLDAQFVRSTKPTKEGFFPVFLRELPPDF